MKPPVSCTFLPALALVAELIACKSESPPDHTVSPVVEHSENPQSSGEWAPTQTEADDVEAVLGEEHFHNTGRHLPRPDELTSWGYVEPPMYFGTSDLFELIDGGAASFIDLGMVQVAYAALSLVDSPEDISRPVGLEIYIFEFATAGGAESKYAADHETSSCQTITRLEPTEHCRTSSSIDLLQSPYYLRFNMDYPGLTDSLFGVVDVVSRRIGAAMDDD